MHLRRTATVRPHHVAGLLAAASLLLAACGSDDASTTDGESTASTETAASESTVIDTTVAPTTTAVAPATSAAPAPDSTAPTVPSTTAPATTAAPTTVAPLVAADLDLGEAAIGPVAFGTGVDPAIAVLAAVLGVAAIDETHEYPYADEVTGVYLDDEDGIFAFPLLRRVCFANGLCTSFGGRDAADLQLVGYDYYSAEVPADPVLTTTAGVPLGARWSDHLDAMTADPGGCYSQGFGASGGAMLVLVSNGEFFGTFDGETYVTAVPDPSVVTVYGIFSGENPGYLYDDC
ncbi:MAG: hypothetical protein KDB40_12250 [Acidimicrobiales bacterium]|nr:hypothetical protein [Acidimicrobiales bacterium]MCB9394105.1 hypothetical protein [Acidimicrobiaceae bacterium]